MKQILKTPQGDPISSMCFGAMQFGGGADESASAEMFDACRAAGINFFDTAFGYTDGQSETILGQLAKSDRENLFVATKCAFDGGAGRLNILDQFDASRKRLNMDSVDLLYIHRWHPDMPLRETFGTLADLVSSGKTRHIGVSNFAAWQVMKAQRVANDFGTTIAALQPMYNLVKRQVEVEVLPMATSEGFSVFPYSPLGGGLLTGKYAAGESGRLTTNEQYSARYGQEWMHSAAEKLGKIAQTQQAHPATLAVAWAARNPAISAPIISARSLEQLQPSLDAMSYEMSDELYAQLCGLAPTPPPATDRTEE